MSRKAGRFPESSRSPSATRIDKVLRASEALDYIRDLLNSARDYYTAKVAQDQNEVVKRLTVVASLLLVPTFIVGVYGQNFSYIPEIKRLGWPGAICGPGC
jgi:magnesium transporter